MEPKLTKQKQARVKEEAVESKQPVINIGMVGHVDKF